MLSVKYVQGGAENQNPDVVIFQYYCIHNNLGKLNSMNTKNNQSCNSWINLIVTTLWKAYCHGDNKFEVTLIYKNLTFCKFIGIFIKLIFVSWHYSIVRRKTPADSELNTSGQQQRCHQLTGRWFKAVLLWNQWISGWVKENKKSITPRVLQQT